MMLTFYNQITLRNEKKENIKKM
uniref:Uncharacterized protein n=1 Tax=Anguilla anguilla TaxID=7936 RepID=A0A0E9XUK9_ANGAN